LWDKLHIIMKIFGLRGKTKVVKNITETANSWLMLIRIVKFRKTQGADRGFGAQEMYTELWLGTMMKEISKWKTVVISCAAKVEGHNEK